MARYIDADKLLEELNEELMYESTMFSKEQEEYLQKGIRIAIGDVKRFPTADVVPKKEVYDLIFKLECLLCHATGGRLSKHTYDLGTMGTVVTDCFNETYNDGFGEGYKECAREIFEEIEKKVKASITIHLEEINKEHIKDTPLYDRHSGILFALQGMNDFIAEFKKKYTEGKI